MRYRGGQSLRSSRVDIDCASAERGRFNCSVKYSQRRIVGGVGWNRQWWRDMAVGLAVCLTQILLSWSSERSGTMGEGTVVVVVVVLVYLCSKRNTGRGRVEGGWSISMLDLKRGGFADPANDPFGDDGPGSKVATTVCAARGHGIDRVASTGPSSPSYGVSRKRIPLHPRLCQTRLLVTRHPQSPWFHTPCGPNVLMEYEDCPWSAAGINPGPLLTPAPQTLHTCRPPVPLSMPPTPTP